MQLDFCLVYGIIMCRIYYKHFVKMNCMHPISIKCSQIVDKKLKLNRSLGLQNFDNLKRDGKVFLAFFLF